jgi:hypothetical protein
MIKLLANKLLTNSGKNEPNGTKGKFLQKDFMEVVTSLEP